MIGHNSVHDEGLDPLCPACRIEQLESDNAVLHAHIQRLERGEYICERCRLRKDSEQPPEPLF